MTNIQKAKANWWFSILILAALVYWDAAWYWQALAGVVLLLDLLILLRTDPDPTNPP